MSAHRRLQPDPRVRLAMAFGALGLVLAAPRPAAALTVAAAVALGLRAGGHLRARALLPTLLVGLPAAALVTWLGAEGSGGLSSGSQATWPTGLARGALLLSRVLASSLVLAWLTAGLRVADLTGALAALRVPAPLLDLLAIADGQRHALRRAFETARAAHALRLGDVGLRRALAASGVLAGAVACRAIELSAVTAEAIQLRGGVATHRLPAFRPTRSDLAHLLATVALLGMATTLAWGPAW